MKPCSSSSRRSMCAVRGLAMRRAYCAWLLLWSFMATIYSLDGQQTPQPPFLRTTCPSIGCLSCADDLQPIECDRQNTSTPQFCYGPICDACESGSGEQEFVLMNGSCGGFFIMRTSKMVDLAFVRQGEVAHAKVLQCCWSRGGLGTS